MSRFLGCQTDYCPAICPRGYQREVLYCHSVRCIPLQTVIAHRERPIPTLPPKNTCSASSGAEPRHSIIEKGIDIVIPSTCGYLCIWSPCSKIPSSTLLIRLKQRILQQVRKVGLAIEL